MLSLTGIFSSKILENNKNLNLQENCISHLSNNYAIFIGKDNRKVKNVIEYDDQHIQMVLTGVLFNKKNSKELANIFAKKFYIEGISFINNLRGAFVGIIFDKQLKKVYAFCDHTSNRRLFWQYCQKSGLLILSTALSYISSIKRNYNIDNILSEPGALEILTYGFHLDADTLINGVQKLLGGTTLTYDLENNKLEISKYFDINTIIPKSLNKEIYLEQLEETFSNAIKNEFERDLQSNATHLITLSGGLDSRAVRIVAYDCGYKENVLNITMSESEYADQLIAQKVSRDLCDEIIFMALDGGNYLISKIDEDIRRNGCTVLYMGCAHLNNFIDHINLEDLGILHTGMIGDAVMGGSLMGRSESDIFCGAGTYSNKLVSLLHDRIKASLSSYADTERFLIVNRAINGAFNGLYSSQFYLEATSPFIDPDVLIANYSIPPELRRSSKIYIEWMEKYHPKMLNYKWESTGCYPNASKHVKYMHRIYRGVKRRILPNNRLSSMNPLEYWYKSNPRIQETFNLEIKMAHDVLKAFPNVYKAVLSLLEQSPNVIELSQIITLSHAIQILNITH